MLGQIAVGADDRQNPFIRRTEQQARMQVVRTELFNASERSSRDSALPVNSANLTRLTGM
jgi:hypothetical protein